MAKINSFDKDNLQLVRAKINEALSKVEQELGIKLDIGNITFARDGSNFKTQLTALAGSQATDPLLDGVDAKYIRDLQRNKGKDALKKVVKISGMDAVIVGLRGSAYIFRWAPGSAMAAKKPGLLRVPYKRYDQLDCEVLGVPFSSLNHL